MKRLQFTNVEYYHIYNRGVDKRNVFEVEGDYLRFLRILLEFNRLDPIGSLVDLEEKLRSESNSLLKALPGKENRNLHEGIGFQTPTQSQRLVDIICYCLNPNHFHLLLRQLSDEGISKFLHKIGVGYTNYFNLKNNRTGALFQGRFKSVEIDSNEDLLWVSAYVNANAQIHGLIKDAANYIWCSYPEYLDLNNENFCHKDIISKQFKDKEQFKSFMNDCIITMREKKELQKYLID
jgi:putative transposase